MELVMAEIGGVMWGYGYPYNRRKFLSESLALRRMGHNSMLKTVQRRMVLIRLNPSPCMAWNNRDE